MKKNLPNLIIAGVPKAASTSLHAYLSKHPQIFGPETKEIAYFAPLVHTVEGKLKDLSEYQKHFYQVKDEIYSLDATPYYIYGGQRVISKMKEILPKHKVIIILRNPVHTFISSYNFFYSRMRYKEDSLESFLSKCINSCGDPLNANFVEADDYSKAIVRGNYVKFLPDWVDAYDTDLRIIYFEDLVAHPRLVMIELANWLKIDATPFESLSYTKENKTNFLKRNLFHTMAFNIYTQFRPFFNKQKKLKSNLKSVYLKLNKTKEQKPKVDNDSLNILKNIYRKSNRELFDFLKERKIQLPPWAEIQSETSKSKV